MGSLMPWGAGVRCSWVAVFKSVLMIASPTLLSNPGSGQCDQLGKGLFLLATGPVAGFRHFCNLDLLQHVLDALVHLAQRLADCAALGLVALAAHCDGRRNKERSINGADRLIRGNI